MHTDINSEKKIWHIILGGTVGNLTEWYNFLLYGYLATVISQEFFPSKNSLLSLTLTFTVFAVSFLMRPLGGILFGWIGDTYGRQRALICSIIMIAIPTFLISILPTYRSIGIASPILLCVFRIMQGLSAGGEHTGSAVYVAEHAPATRRSLWVSTIPTSAALGILFSSTMAFLIVSVFTPEQLLAWGWRVGYWIGTVMCLISLGIRVGMPETPDFEKTHKKKTKSKYAIAAFFAHADVWKNLIITFVLAGAWGIYYQILFIWMPTYLIRFQHFSNSISLRINSLYLLIFAFLIIGVGFTADKISRKVLLIISNAAMLTLSYPLFLMLSSGVMWQIYAALGIFTVIFSLYIPVAFVCMLELFSIQIRYTGLSLGFNTGLAIFGGTCPLIATWLIEWSGNKMAPAFYMMLAAAFGILIAVIIDDKRGKPI